MMSKTKLQWVCFGASAFLSIAACGDDDSGTSDGRPVDSGTTTLDARVDASPAPNDARPAPTGDASQSSECLSAVYDGLSDGCAACTCTANPAVAPSCGKACWDFLACSFRAQSGACAQAAAGGAATRAEFEACTMTECGAQLAVPGAQAVSSPEFRAIVGACVAPMGGSTPACGADVAKFISQL
jgi:hypothetical protein